MYNINDAYNIIYTSVHVPTYVTIHKYNHVYMYQS